MDKQYLKESVYVDLPEEELRNLLGYLHEKIKTLEEQKKADEELERLKAVVKAYEDENYGDHIKDTRKALAAARSVAKMRGIHFTVKG